MIAASHVHFDAIDVKEEAERSMKGFDHRRELVRGIKFQKANDERLKEAQTEYGYTWLRDESINMEKLQGLDLGVQLIIQGFLVFFYEETTGKKATQDFTMLYDHFQKTPRSLVELSKKLKEVLATVSFVINNNDVGLPDDQVDEHSLKRAC